jgi:hypothetical protein
VSESSVRPRTRTLIAARPSYYVTSSNGAQLLLLLGPFASELAARARVDDVEDALLTRGDVHAALEVRSTRVIGTAARPGDLNAGFAL